MNLKQNAKTLEQARARHGKPFAPEIHVRRRTRPSRLLRRLNALSAHAAQRNAAAAAGCIHSNRGDSMSREQAPAQRVRPAAIAAGSRHVATAPASVRKEAAA